MLKRYNKQLLKFILILIAGTIVAIISFFNAFTSNASTSKTITLFVGESWSLTMTYSDNYIGTVNGTKKGNKYVKEHATASINGKKLTIKATDGNNNYNTFYIYRKNGELARTVRVYVKTKPNISSVSNNTSIKSKSPNAYIYIGNSTTATFTYSGTKDSVLWSFKKISGSNANGITLSNTTGNAVTIKGVTAGTYTLTVKITTKSTNSTQAASKSINIYIYEKPYINFTYNGNVISSLTLNKGQTKSFSYTIGKINTSATCTVTPKVNDNSNNYISVTNDTSTGYCKVSTKEAFTKNMTAYITLTLVINSGDSVSNNNGSQAITKTIPVKLSNYFQITAVRFNTTSKKLVLGKTFFQKPLIEPSNQNVNDSFTWKSSNPNIASVDANGNVSTHNIGTATITATTTDGGNQSAFYTIDVISQAPLIAKFNETKFGLKVSWNSLKDITSYELYRSSSLNGEYTKIATTKGLFYSDTSALYNKKYYYKLSAIPMQGAQYTSELSVSKSIKHILPTPRIKKVKKIGKKRIFITISSTRYDGFIVYMGNKKKTKKAVNFIKGNKCVLAIKPKKKKYIRVQAYIMQNNKRIFSSYSKAQKIKIK